MKVAIQPIKSTPLYRSIANRIVEMIDSGTFHPGVRIPSVRRLSHDWNVSISTVLEAYRWLETNGVIEVRPKSGHYVRFRPDFSYFQKEKSPPPPEPANLRFGDLVLSLLKDTNNPDILPLGAGIPCAETLPPQKLNQVLASVARKKAHRAIAYAFPPGWKKLRVEIAKRLLICGCTVHPSQIVITNGCAEAFTIALQAVCSPGDAVAVESPGYFGFIQTCESLRMKPVEIPTDPTTGISLGTLRYAIENHAIRACIVNPNFHNPTGAMMPESNKQEMVSILSHYRIPLIEDDLYGDLPFDNIRPKACKAFDRTDSVLYCSSFSKTLAPGYRIGWIVPGRYQNEVERIKASTNFATATVLQLAIADFLADNGYEHHLRKIRKMYERKTVWLSQAVVNYFPEGTRISTPKGGFLLWIALPESICSYRFYELSREKGISIAPGKLFSMRDSYPNYIRLNAAYACERHEPKIRMLGEIAHHLVK